MRRYIARRVRRLQCDAVRFWRWSRSAGEKAFIPAIMTGTICVIAAWYFWPSVLSKMVARQYSSLSTPQQQGLTELGQAGDAFGGFNALVGVATILLLALAAVYQRRSLHETRTFVGKQLFEDHFFRLLQLARESAEEIKGTFDTAGGNRFELEGLPALNAYASRVRHAYTQAPISPEVWQKLKAMKNEADAVELYMLVVTYLRECYGKQPSAFGPYMRMQYRLFWYIDNSNIPEDQKLHYIKLAAASIPEGSVLLLALNGLTRHGSENFHPLIEKFGLLEHLHPFYIARFKSALEAGYDWRAFTLIGLYPVREARAEMANFDFDGDLDDDESLSLQ